MSYPLPRPPAGTVRAWSTPVLLACALLLAQAAHGADGLSLAEAQSLALQQAPALRALRATLAGSVAAQPAAATLPDPRLSVGLENLPVAGPDRWSSTRDLATMQRLSLMQDVPNRDKRQAREQAARARVERDRVALRVAELSVRRDAALAWLGVRVAEARRALLADLQRQNRLLQDTLPARIASGAAPAADLAMARQDALMLADRGDELSRDVRRARAELRRWVGDPADGTLAGEAALAAFDRDAIRHALPHHAELAPFSPQRALAQAELAETEAEGRGDWSWELAYSRRPRYDDMVSLQFSFELPWQRERRQQPQAEARRRELERIDAERDDLLRRHAAETEAMLAELEALDAQAARLQRDGLPLAAERVALALAAYQAGRGELSGVLAARSQTVELRLRAIDIDGQRDALRIRLTHLVSEDLR